MTRAGVAVALASSAAVLVLLSFRRSALLHKYHRTIRKLRLSRSFNSQPPEGGWEGLGNPALVAAMFQLTAARRRLDTPDDVAQLIGAFQLTAARRRLGIGGGAQTGV